METKSIKETAKIAEQLIQTLISKGKGGQATIIGLHGDLGSGKTTFTQCLAQALGITEPILSPTFVIIKTYNLPQTTHNKSGLKKLIHIDAYRLENAQDMEKLGWKEMIENPENLIIIEWPERISSAMPKNYTKIDFRFINDTTREIIVR